MERPIETGCAETVGDNPMYTCRVCAFDELSHPPEAYMICPCCGTEFENDDEDVSHEELRNRWIAGGMKWWSPNSKPPEGWDPRRLRTQG